MMIVDAGTCRPGCCIMAAGGLSANKGCMQLLGFLLLGVGVPLGLIISGVSSWQWLGLGALAWGVSLGIKVIPRKLAAARLPSTRHHAAVWGTWSALCELGLAALVFAVVDPRPSFNDALGFGAGAGSVEVLYTLVFGIVVGIRSPSQDDSQQTHPFVAWSGVIERVLTLIGHVATRLLVWEGTRSMVGVWGALFGFASFAVVDGVATYGTLARWEWTEPRTSMRFYAFLFAVTLLEALVVLIVLRG
jgi:hypothetical protein